MAMLYLHYTLFRTGILSIALVKQLILLAGIIGKEVVCGVLSKITGVRFYL